MDLEYTTQAKNIIQPDKDIAENQIPNIENNNIITHIRRFGETSNSPNDEKKVDYPTLNEDNFSLLGIANVEINYTWTCPSCKLIHLENVDKCNACKTDCLPKLWDVSEENVILQHEPTCTNHKNAVNIKNNDKNIVLQQTEETNTIKIIDATIPNDWRCSICTFSNSQTLTRCRMCQYNKFTETEIVVKEERPIDSNNQRWMCQDCLLINSGDVQNCTGCRSDRIFVLTMNQNEKVQYTNITTNNNAWECFVCNSKNIEDSNKCSTCKSERLVEKPPNLEEKTVENNVKLASETYEPSDLIKNDNSGANLNISINQENNNWICHKCTLLNPEEVENCRACQTSKLVLYEQHNENISWICYLCTLQNSKHVEICSMCGADKKIISENSQNPRTTNHNGCWMCPICTLQNSEEDDNCSACQASKVLNEAASINLQTNENNKWMCQTCTLENTGQADKCSACQARKVLSNEAPSKTTANLAKNYNWTCKMCTIENSTDVEKCSVCQTNKLEIKEENLNVTKNIISVVENNMLDWLCSQCSFKNNVNIKKCSACGTNRRQVTITTVDRNAVVQKIEINHVAEINDGVLRNKWRCVVCTFLNSDTLTQCRTCRTNKATDIIENSPDDTKNCPKKWKCHICTLINPADLNKCSACETDRRVEIAASVENNTPENIETNSNDWTCIVCTLQNQSDSNQCSACQTGKLVEPAIPIEEETSETWRCPACTFLNHIEQPECLLCGQFGRIKIIDCESETTEQCASNSNSTRDNASYLELVEVSNAVLVNNSEPFYCIICMSDCQPGDGVILSECLHQFCR